MLPDDFEAYFETYRCGTCNGAGFLDQHKEAVCDRCQGAGIDPEAPPLEGD